MTDPKLKEARIAEAERRARQEEWKGDRRHHEAAMRHLLDVITEDWRPEPEVDAVTLAAREWITSPANVDATYTDAFRAGHAHALANHPDAKRMDWLEGQKLSIEATRVKDDLHHYPNATPTLRTKIDRAMEGGE